MAEQPLVSVVLPTRNGSRYIAQSIESVLGQNHGYLELIVVDGGSSDNTCEIVARYQDSRLRLISQVNIRDRLPGALNEGFMLARGTYFTWTQDDDLMAPNALNVLASYLDEHPATALAYAGYWWIDDQSRIIGESDTNPPDALTWTNPVGHCFLYRRTAAEKVGEYDAAYLMAEDAEYWLRIYRAGRVDQIPGRYYYHRRHGGSLTGLEYRGFEARYVAARARRNVLHIPWHIYQLQIAATCIEEAFAAYARRDWARVRRCLARGLVRDPRWLRNRGVLSIGWQSLTRSTRRA